MKKTLSVSIMTSNPMELKKEINQLKKANVTWLHCDVMDGVFVNNLAMGPYQIEWIKKDTNLTIDIHLATITPERFIDMFGVLGPDYITFHIEATDNPLEVINKIKSYNCKVGIALNPETPFKTIEHLIDKIDLILVMTVSPGFAGQKFRIEVIDKLMEIADFFKEETVRPIIQVDGNINKETMELMRGSIVDLFVLGTSALYNNDQSSIHEKLVRLNDYLLEW
ncbi:ribulose-phosphate 3-epimerase [Aerococcaceae bacterium WGS1372]